MGEASHRERSKLKRRLAIERAALELFADQGYESTTLAQIAERADVAPRTIALYFASKIDLVLSRREAASTRLAELIDQRPDGEPLIDVVERWTRAELRTDPEMITLHARVVSANPTLRGLQSDRIAGSAAVIGSGVAADLDRAANDPAVQLFRGVLVGVLVTIFEGDFTVSDQDAAVEVGMDVLRAAWNAIAENPRRG